MTAQGKKAQQEFEQGNFNIKILLLIKGGYPMKEEKITLQMLNRYGSGRNT